MIEVLNDTKKYWNQYHDVTDLPETIKDERRRTCGITCLSMITGEHPDQVLQNMFKKYGKNDKFQWEEHLIKYLRDREFKCVEMTKIAWPKPRRIKEKELEKMRDEIDKGKIILYHKKGHYQLMVGYVNNGSCYIFNDPAGDRTLPVSKRKRKSGYNIMYTDNMVLSEIIYGRCWSVEI